MGQESRSVGNISANTPAFLKEWHYVQERECLVAVKGTEIIHTNTTWMFLKMAEGDISVVD